MSQLTLAGKTTERSSNTPMGDTHGRDLVLANDGFFSQVLGEGYLKDPYPLLAELQHEAPVYHSPLGPWVISGYQDVLAALKNPELVGDPRGTQLYANYVSAGAEQDFGSQALSHMQFVDGLEHLRVRRNFATYLNNADNKKQQRQWIHEITEQLLDDMEKVKDEVEFVGAFAGLLPARLFCRILGVPKEDAPQLAKFAKALVAADDPGFLLSKERLRITAEASQEMSRYLSIALIRRKKNPEADFLSHLLNMLADRQFDNFEELIINLIFFIVAGIKTTADFLSNTLAALQLFPEQAELFISGQHNVGKLLDECFRYDSPIQQTPRFSAAPVSIGGVSIPSGEHLMLMIGAANRDPSMFSEPHCLQLLRDNAKAHIAFGGGAHHCLGSVFARMEAEHALPALLVRFSQIHQITAPKRMVGFTLRGFDYFPISVKTGDATE